jgi:hypothetical protein
MSAKGLKGEEIFMAMGRSEAEGGRRLAVLAPRGLAPLRSRAPRRDAPVASDRAPQLQQWPQRSSTPAGSSWHSHVNNRWHRKSQKSQKKHSSRFRVSASPVVKVTVATL